MNGLKKLYFYTYTSNSMHLNGWGFVHFQFYNVHIYINNMYTQNPNLDL